MCVKAEIEKKNSSACVSSGCSQDVMVLVWGNFLCLCVLKLQSIEKHFKKVGRKLKGKLLDNHQSSICLWRCWRRRQWKWGWGHEEEGECFHMWRRQAALAGLYSWSYLWATVIECTVRWTGCPATSHTGQESDMIVLKCKLDLHIFLISCVTTNRVPNLSESVHKCCTDISL